MSVTHQCGIVIANKRRVGAATIYRGVTHHSRKRITVPDYRRSFVKGGTFFFTVVTYNRRPIFAEESSVQLFKRCLYSTIEKHPFIVDAFVILPDHLHTIWTLPDGESDFSTRWKVIKATFSHHYSGPKTKNIPESMLKKNEKGIWQRRFFEHAIRNEEDFNRHCDYIHYNPVKHGLVKSPIEWKESSLEDFIKKGIYPLNWGSDTGKELSGLELE